MEMKLLIKKKTFVISCNPGIKIAFIKIFTGPLLQDMGGRTFKENYKRIDPQKNIVILKNNKINLMNSKTTAAYDSINDSYKIQVKNDDKKIKFKFLVLKPSSKSGIIGDIINGLILNKGASTLLTNIHKFLNDSIKDKFTNIIDKNTTIEFIFDYLNTNTITVKVEDNFKTGGSQIFPTINAGLFKDAFIKIFTDACCNRTKPTLFKLKNPAALKRNYQRITETRPVLKV